MEDKELTALTKRRYNPPMAIEIPVISFRHGDHICLFYRDQQEQMGVAAPFVQIGLLKGERCLCVLTVRETEILFASLRAVGMNPDREVSSGALLVATPEQAYLRGGRFHREEMIHFLDQAMKEAVSLGFSGFRGTGDLSWCAADMDSCSQMPEYEAALDRYFPGKPALGICMYDLRLFRVAQVNTIMKAHRLAILKHGDNNRAVRIRKSGFFGDVIFDAIDRSTLFHYVVQKDDSSAVLMSGQNSTLSGAMRAVETAIVSWAAA